MGQYKAATGLTASMQAGVLTVQWAGSDGAELRTRYAVAEGTPVVRELAVRKTGGTWATLGQDLKPEYRVVSGIRRFSSQQGEPLQGIGQLTPERAEKEKWYAYRDAPLYMGPPAGPGGPGGAAGAGGRGGARGGGGGDPDEEERPAGGRGGGRGGAPAGPPFPYTSPKPEDIRRASSSFKTNSCSVKTDGARIEVTFNGLSMGIFSGSLQFTAYRGTNLIRMDAVASTNEPSVAYKFDAGLTGFSTTELSRMAWNDIAGSPAQYQFGAPKNDNPVVVRADNRVIVAEGPGGSLAAFPMPHQAFWPRQHFINLGYLWYRKDADTSFSFGVRQAEQEEVNNFTTFELINAPPGTMQRMGIYFYASPLRAEPTRQAVLAFTHNDMFKPVAGYKTMVNHMHSTIKAQVMAQTTPELARDVVALRSTGANIVGDSERGNDIQGLADYAKALATQSDKDFLMLPWDEPGQQFGGHWNALWPKSVLWNRSRAANVPFSATDPKLGKYYNVGSKQDMQRLLDEEDGYWYHAHPRTKGTAGYPDAIWDEPYIKNDRYLGVAFKLGMGLDLSNMRGACEWRCFDALDTMNNKNVGTGLRPKYLIADIDDYEKAPDYDLYPQIPVTYIKLDRVPGPTESWAPILTALHNGNMWVTTGEILIRSYAVEGTGNQRTVNADLEWTFPLEFVEVTVGDGKTVTRQTIRATDLPPNSSKRFTIPVDATGKAWVRFSAFDSAGNQAYAEPQWFNPANR